MKLRYASKAANLKKSVALLVLILLSATSIAAQTTAFTYQGKLTDNGNPANGSYDLQFKLFDTGTVGTGVQQGSTVTVSNVTVAGGIFTVSLDFGACASCFNGAARFLEIAVKPTSGGVFTTLSPRQPLTSSPYAIKSLNATAADGLSVTCVNCITSSQIASVNGSAVSGTIPVASVPAGSTSYIQNTNTQQATSNFNISGNGFVGGNVGIGTTNPTARLTVRGAGAYNAPGAPRFDLFNTTAGAGYLQHVTDSGLFQIATTGGASRLIIDPSGNIGIGAVPSGFYRLDVVGFGGVRAFDNGTGPAHFVAETSGGTGAWARMYMRTTNQSWFIGTSQNFNGDQLYIWDETANQIRMAIYPNGNVGIGTTNPQYKLHVDGGSVPGVYGTGAGFGVRGVSSGGHGVYGTSTIATGVYGTSFSSYGVLGVSTNGYGVRGECENDCFGVSGYSNNGIAVIGTSATGYAGYYQGNVYISGTLAKGGGSFKIDHPLDPENKYLYHSFVESPDMKNIYDGNITTDANGEAIITLPDWFESLNRDFRYQLTVIGTFAQAIVAEEIKGNRFTIKTSAPNVKVSWQVTGIRHDAFANKHRIPVEEAKPEVERGYFLHPEVFNQPEEKNVQWARHPEAMKRMKERQREMEQQRQQKPQ